MGLNTALLVFLFPRPCQKCACNSSWCSEPAEKDGLPSGLFPRYQISVARKYCSHIPGPIFCPCCHFLGHRSHTSFCFNTRPAICRYLLPCGFDRLPEVWQMGKRKTNKLTFDSLLASHGQRQGMCGVDYMRSQCLAWLLGMLIEFRHAGTMDRDLTKLPCEIWRALAFVPWTALAAIHTWKMAND